MRAEHHFVYFSFSFKPVKGQGLKEYIMPSLISTLCSLEGLVVKRGLWKIDGLWAMKLKLKCDKILFTGISAVSSLPSLLACAAGGDRSPRAPVRPPAQPSSGMLGS